MNVEKVKLSTLKETEGLKPSELDLLHFKDAVSEGDSLSSFYEERQDEFYAGLLALGEAGFYRVQMPYSESNLPALMAQWNQSLKESGEEIYWLKLRPFNSRRAVYAVAGAHVTDDGQNHFVIHIFNKDELEWFEQFGEK